MIIYNFNKAFFHIKISHNSGFIRKNSSTIFSLKHNVTTSNPIYYKKILLIISDIGFLNINNFVSKNIYHKLIRCVHIILFKSQTKIFFFFTIAPRFKNKFKIYFIIKIKKEYRNGKNIEGSIYR